MPAVATSRLRLIKQETYSNPDAWGEYLNSGALDMADQAFGVAEIAVGANVSLDAQNFVSDEARRMVLILSGAGGFSVTAPAVDKPYLVINDCAADVTIGPFGGTFATVRAGTQVWYTTNEAGTVGRVVDPTLDEVKKPAASVDFNGQRAVNVADPVDPQDAATRKYIDDLAASSDLGTVAAIADEIVTVAHIQDGTVATDAVTDVAAISGEIVDLSGITNDIVQLAGMFVGASATDPATRLDGTPLQAGDYYLNTSGTPTVRVYSGSAWIPIEAVAVASKSEAETGSDNTKMMTPLRTAQFHAAVAGSQTFTTSGTFTKPSNATVFLVEVWGAGGGGGRGAQTTTSGGAGGGYVSALINASDIASSTAVTIGAGGAGANPGGTTGGDGSAGGDSSFGSLVVAKGGNPGKSAASQIALPGGSNLTVASSAIAPTVRALPLSVYAGYGDYGSNPGGNTIYGGGGGGGANGGAGGLSPRGGAGGAGVDLANAADGVAPGGGGGGNGVTTSGTRAGNGARGEVRVYWW